MNTQDAMNLCTYPGCNDVHKCRGLCKRHYDATRVMIIRGEVTQEELFAAGIWQHRQDGRRRANMDFVNDVLGKVRSKRKAA